MRDWEALERKKLAEDLIVEYLPVADLVPYAANSRTHSDEQVAQIASSIRAFGFTNPVLITPENDIIAGHGRVKAATKIGLERVPCVRLGHLSATERKAYVIADNRLALNAGWDIKMLEIEIEALREEAFDLELLGFEEKELEALVNPEVEPADGLTDPDAVPENVETRCKPGDLWVLGGHRLLCGDSTDVLQVERLMGGEKADMVFTDPPYGMSLDTDFSSMKSRMIEGGKGGKHRPVEGDDHPFDPALILTLFESAREVFLWGADYYAERIESRNEGSWVVWDKRASQEYLDTHADVPFDRLFGSSFELCWSRQRHKRDLARVPSAGALGHGSNEKRVHPTQKPVKLAEWFFERWGKPADLVADLFLGSGSTLIACEKTARRCFGMELDPKYCDVVLSRWEQFTGKQAVREETDG